jgi:lysophospholipase L1-like esterase
MRIHHVNILVPMDGTSAAVAFYVDILGLRRIPKPPGAGSPRGAWLEIDARTQVHISERDATVHPDAHFAIVLDDYDATITRLNAAGAAFTPQANEFGGRRGFTRDPAGNRVELIEGSTRETLFIVGDSIAFGAWDVEGGWAERLKRKLVMRSMHAGVEPPLVYNLGVPGETSADVLRRFEHEVEQRLAREQGRSTVIVACGMNDAKVVDGTYQVSIEACAKNVGAIVDAAKKRGGVCVIVGVTQVDETIIPTRRNATLRQYDARLASVAREHGAAFVDVHDAIPAGELLADDGIHPNAAGHSILYERIQRVLDELARH